MGTEPRVQSPFSSHCKCVSPAAGVPGSACTKLELTQRLRTWFEQLPEPVTLVFDFECDWLLLADSLLGAAHKLAPANGGEKLHLASHTITHPVFEEAQNLTYTQDWPPHHALADARALMAGFRAWKAFMEPIRRIQS